MGVADSPQELGHTEREVVKFRMLRKRALRQMVLQIQQLMQEGGLGGKHPDVSGDQTSGIPKSEL